MKCKEEFSVPRFIPHEVKKKIQQIGLGYGIFSQIVKTKTAVVVLAENSSKEKPRNNQAEERDKS